MGFVSMTPPHFDCENFNDLTKIKKVENVKQKVLQFVSDDCDLKDSQDSDTFLVLGLSKGTLIFLQICDLDSIYARFSIHR